MPGNDKKKNVGKNGEKRSDRKTKSVLLSDNPLFKKSRVELPIRHKNLQGFRRLPLLDELSRKFQPLDERYNLRPKIVIVFLAVFLSFFIFHKITDPFYDYRLGEIAQRHFISQHILEFVDKDTTEAKRKQALQSVLPVYDYDHQIIHKNTQQMRNAFQQMRKKFPNLVKKNRRLHRKALADGGEKLSEFQEARKLFASALGLEVSDGEFKSAMRLNFSYKFERTLIHLFSAIDNRLLVLSKEVLNSSPEKGIIINHLNDPFLENREEVFKNLSTIVDIKKSRENLLSKGSEIFLSSRKEDEKNIFKLMSKLVVPNLTFNKQITERRKTAVVDEVNPVIIKISKGDIIVRYGDRITERHLTILRYMETQQKDQASHVRFLFTVILLTILLYVLYKFCSHGFESYTYTFRDLVVFMALMVGTILSVKGIQFVAIEAFREKFPQIPLEFYQFLLPLGACPVVIRMISSRLSALMFMIIMSVICGILLDRSFFFVCYALITSLTATTLANRIKTRRVIYRMGLITGLVNIVVITCIAANVRDGANLSLLWDDMYWIFWAGFLSGLLTSAVVTTLVPIIEFFSGHSTDLRLLELASMDHPLLQELMVKAPGTYHHSIIIGSLVEKSADAIGANPLLARVMAYYHDVGKTERPLYFIENQGGGYNRHDGLQPHMSAMIIREHVKRGQELGYKYKLPQPIIDAMSEHHGSSTITYFYNKARGLAEDPDSVMETDYQYDGESPQSKESALVMLGDVVEAATRSLVDPTPLRLSGLVRNVLNKYFAEGHLSECSLTLRDLDLIAKNFVDVLIGIYHARIDYGVSITKELDVKKKENGNLDSKGNGHKRAGGGTLKARNM